MLAERLCLPGLESTRQCSWVFCSNSTVINIANNHDFVSKQEAGVKSGLLQAKVLEGLAHMVEPQDGSDRESIQTLDESKTGVWTIGRAETTGQMDPHKFFKLSLDEGRAEVNCHGLPVKDQ